LKCKNFSAAIFLATAVVWLVGNAFACGPFFPNNLLDAGDQAVLQAPVADFERELARMKLLPVTTHAVPLADGQKFYEQSTAAELTDLAAALKRKKNSSEAATVIMQAHLAERMKLNAFLKAQNEWEHFGGWVFDTNGYHQLPNTNPPPVFPEVAVTPGLPREFALYFQGAIAWQKNAGWSSCEVWQQLLALPEPERHFKSTWAEFMLARYHENLTNEWADREAMKHFEQVGALAKNGFADSLGLATASLGGEAQIFLRRKNFERAIKLYLQQFAAGDDTALESLRFSAARAMAETNFSPALLQTLALDSQARRVITAYLISRNPYNDPREAESSPEAKQFFDVTSAWLEAVESARVNEVESASQLALAAYQAGEMEIAQRWINRAGREPVAQWLQAKLFMRAGKIAEAAKLLAKLSRKFPLEFSTTNAPPGFAQSLSVSYNEAWDETIPVGRQAFGELGVLRLARREYAEALDALLRSGYWMDAAYIAERVLTTDELKNYVDRNWPAVTSAKTVAENDRRFDDGWPPENVRDEIRCLLARRLARENRFAGTRDYFPENLRTNFDVFTTALRIGTNQNLANELRAKNLFAAAIMARTNGMELFGTELEPDWAIYGGDYEAGFTWMNRATNLFAAKINVADTNEIARASSRHVVPEERFHYRYRAAELAWQAAQWMPDNSDATARVLCTAGTWLKDRDPQSADKFYKALVRRCRHTALGQQADLIRWFPAQEIGGNLPRLETIEITAEVTNAAAFDNQLNFLFSTEFPVPGRKYSVHEDEDVYIIARAVQRLGCVIRADDIVRANPGLKRGPLSAGQLIFIPPASAGATHSPP
jgi:hypothetical protein